MPNLQEIENLEDTKKKVIELAQKINSDFNDYLGSKKEEELKSCPVCAGEFDPVEIGIEDKNIEDFWSKKGNKEFQNLTEQITVEIFTIVQKIIIKPKNTEVEINKKLQELTTAIQALREITKIMSGFKAVYQKIKDDETAIKTMFKTLADIDKILALIYSKRPPQ